MTINHGLEGVVAAETALSLVDGERGELIIAGFPVAELARFLQLGQTLSDTQVIRRFRSAGVDILAISTAVPYDRQLLRFFRERVLRKR